MTNGNLEERLTATDPEVRRVAVGALAQLGTESIPLLMVALGDDDWRVRKEATQVVNDLPPGKELARAIARAFLPNDNVGLRNAAVEALAAQGHWAIEAVEGVLGDLDADGRKLAAEALGMSRQAATVPTLRRLALDEDQNVRVAALEALGHVGSSGAPEVSVILNSALLAVDPLERLSALEALNELGIVLDWTRLQELAVDTLLQRAVWNAAARMMDVASARLLASRISDCRESDFPWAVAALAARINHDVASLAMIRSSLSDFAEQRRIWLHQLLSSELLEHRQAALLVLSALGGKDAVQAAFDVLADDSLAATAERALVLLQEESLSLIKEKVTAATTPAEQALAIEMMARLVGHNPSPEAMAAICEALNSDNPAVLRAALEFLEHTSDETCLRRAFERFDSVAAVVESFAVEALQSMVQRHPSFARELVEHVKLNGPDALAAVVAMATLINCSAYEAATRNEFLGRALAHESPRVRRVAIESLVSCGDAASTAMALFALTDEEPQVRRAAVRALGRASDANAVERLVEIVRTSEDTDLVVSAIQALGESDGAQVLQVLRPVARSGAPVVAVAAVEAIARLSDSRRIDALIDSLSHVDAEVVKAALQMLVSESDLRTNAHLGACLDHEAWDVRRLAADLLGRIGGDSVTALLRTKLALEPEPLVRDAILRALGDTDASNYVCRNTPCVDIGSWRPK